MSITIESVSFKSLCEVAYVGKTSYFPFNREDKATVNFSINTDNMKLEGFLELSKKEYEENVSNLAEVIKDKLVKSL